MQESHAPCVKARGLARCAAAPGGLPVTFMFLNVCERRKKNFKKGQERVQGCGMTRICPVFMM